MPSLVDLIGAPETVPFRGATIAVNRIGLRRIAALIGRFPELGALLATAEKRAELASGGEALKALASSGPDIVEAVIAAGTGSEPEQVRQAELGLEEEIDLLSAIVRLTFPNGFGPVAEKIKALGLIADAEETPAKPSRRRLSN